MKKITLLLIMLLTAFSMEAQTSYGSLIMGNAGTQGGNSSSYFGYQAGRLSTGARNSFVGFRSGYFNVSGYDNSFLGVYAGYRNDDGYRNSFVGYRSGFSNTSGHNNAFVGAYSGYRNDDGIRNSFAGNYSGYNNTSGGRNTFMGYISGYRNSTGSNNTNIGYGAGYNNSTGSGNVFMGYNAGYSETGSNKLYIDNSSTSSPLIKGDFSANTLTFNGDVGVGEAIPTGNTVPTDISLYVRGRFAQEFSGTIGGFGSSDRWSSLGTSFAPSGNIPSVYGMINQWGDNSLISGVKSGSNSALIWSGPNARLDFDYFNTTNFTNQTYMSILSNGSVGIGTTNTGSYKLYVIGEAYSTVNWSGSDKRYKKDIKTIDSALEKINALDGVSYKFKQKVVNDIDFNKVKQGNHLGFIAQDLEKVFPELVRKDDAGYYAVNYDGLVPVLVEGMKEQQEVITEQKQEMDDLKARIDKLEALLMNNSNNNINNNNSGIRENADLSNIVLRQNAPNPFSDETTIEYELPKSLNAAQLVIYDLNGRVITSYDITGKGNVKFNASKLSSGTYIYAIVADGKSIANQKMVIQK